MSDCEGGVRWGVGWTGVARTAAQTDVVVGYASVGPIGLLELGLLETPLGQRGAVRAGAAEGACRREKQLRQQFGFWRAGLLLRGRGSLRHATAGSASSSRPPGGRDGERVLA